MDANTFQTVGRGRPEKYSKEYVQWLIDGVAAKGVSLRKHVISTVKTGKNKYVPIYLAGVRHGLLVPKKRS